MNILAARATRLGALWCAGFFFFLALCGCGGGGGVTSPPPGSGGGTPPPTGEVISIVTPANVSCVQNVPFTLTLQATGNQTPITWSVTSGQLPLGLALDATSGIISGTPTASFTSVTIQAADAKVSASRMFFFSLFAQLVINPVTPPPAHVNAPYSVTVTGQGSSAIATWGISAGQLPPGLSLAPSPNSANVIYISGTPTQAGSYSFTIKATDYTLPQTATLDLSITVDTHLAITKSALKNGEKGVAYSDSFAAVNGTAPYHWLLSGPLPAGLALNTSTGLISGTPTDFGGTTYTVTVTDSSTPEQTDSAQLTLSIAQALQILGTFPTAYIGQFYYNSLVAIGGFYPYTWSVISGTLPPGLNFSGGSLSGTPTQLGSFTFVVQITDAGSPAGTATQTITLNVTPTPLNIFGSPLSPAPVNVPYHSQIPVSGGTPPYSVILASGQLPPGLTLDSTTGNLDGTPSQVGTFNFAIKGTDSSSPPQSATANDFIVIQKGLGRNDSIATASPIGNSANVNIPVPYSISPYIDPINAATANPDTDFFKLVATAGSIVHVETFAQRSWGANTLDSVIELLDENGNRLQSCGAPTYSSVCLNDDRDSATLDSALDLKVAGSVNTQKTIYAHVFDWRGDARPDMQYYLNVSGVVEPLKISPTSLGAGATRGTSYQQQFTATGGSGNVSWTLDGGSLPPGWSLSSTGLLSGTAAADGFYTFAIKGTDSGNPAQTSRVQFTIQIAEPVTITSPAVFPNACLNKPYSFTVTTTGGIPPIVFSFISNHWTGINLDQSTGTFSGSSSITGTFTGTVGANDSAQPSSGQGQVVTLNVVNCP